MRYNKNMPTLNHTLTGKTLAISIGVVVVLGIVAVVTIPLFQTNHRNSERVRHLNQLAEAIIAWQEENQGELPTDTEIQELEIMSEFQDPDGNDYQIVLNNRSDNATADTMTLQRQSSIDHKIYIYYSASCSGDFPAPVTNAQKFAVFYKLEGASKVYCVDNATQ